MATPPGSNVACEAIEGPRVRRDWDRTGEQEKALYLDAVETAVERGFHQRFAAYHSDSFSDLQAHETCAFFLWHRRFLLSYENMLRSLAPRFACVTVPFWNIASDYGDQKAGLCDTYSSCNNIVDRLGGFSRNDDVIYRQFNGRETHGFLHDGPPIQNLYDDYHDAGIVRFDMWFEEIPPSADPAKLVDLFVQSGSNQVSLWRKIHDGIHDDIHNTIGGFMRTTSSPVDPVFFPWHATVDMLGWFWEQCHASNENGVSDHWADAIRASASTCWYDEEAKEAFPTMALNTSEIHLELDSIPIEQDPQIGIFFSDDLGKSLAGMAAVQQFNEHWQYTYDSAHVSIRQRIQNSTVAASGTEEDPVCTSTEAFIESDVYAATTRNATIATTVRTYSKEEIDSIAKQWVARAETHWRNQLPYEEALVQLKVAKVECILQEQDHDTMERWAIDDVFVDQIVEGWFVHHYSCDLLPTAVSPVVGPTSSRSFIVDPLSPAVVVIWLLATCWLLRR